MMALTKDLLPPGEVPPWMVTMALCRPSFEAFAISFDLLVALHRYGQCDRSWARQKEVRCLLLLCTSELGVTWSKCDDCEWCSFVDPPTLALGWYDGSYQRFAASWRSTTLDGHYGPVQALLRSLCHLLRPLGGPSSLRTMRSFMGTTKRSALFAFTLHI